MSVDGKQIERELQLAKRYWLERIRPHIARRRLQGIELFVAVEAHSRLRKITGEAWAWNNTEAGKASPIPSEALPDFGKEEFREPEELCADANLKPETLAVIAARLAGQSLSALTPDAAMPIAHEFLMAAER